MNRRSECFLFARKRTFIYLLLRPQTVGKFCAAEGTLSVTAGSPTQKNKRAAYILLLSYLYNYSATISS